MKLKKKKTFCQWKILLSLKYLIVMGKNIPKLSTSNIFKTIRIFSPTVIKLFRKSSTV